MAPPARLELTTLRLGGVRSILVSYGGISNSLTYFTQKKTVCQGKIFLFKEPELFYIPNPVYSFSVLIVNTSGR